MSQKDNPSHVQDIKDVGLIRNFLEKEYEIVAQVSHQASDLRVKLVGFYLAFAGAASAIFAVLISGNTSDSVFVLPHYVAGSILLALSGVGILTAEAIGRLKRKELEHLRIMQNLRNYVLREVPDLQTIIQFSDQSFPRPSRQSSTYLWVIMVSIVSSGFAAVSVYLLYVPMGRIAPATGYLVSLAIFILVAAYIDFSYFRAAKPRKFPAN